MPVKFSQRVKINNKVSVAIPVGSGAVLPNLNALTLSGTTFTTDDPQGTLIGTIGGYSSGTTLAINPADPRVQINGTRLEVGSLPITSLTTFTVTLEETGLNYANSPRATTFSLTATVAGSTVLTLEPVGKQTRSGVAIAQLQSGATISGTGNTHFGVAANGLVTVSETGQALPTGLSDSYDFTVVGDTRYDRLVFQCEGNTFDISANGLTGYNELSAAITAAAANSATTDWRICLRTGTVVTPPASLSTGTPAMVARTVKFLGTYNNPHKTVVHNSELNYDERVTVTGGSCKITCRTANGAGFDNFIGLTNTWWINFDNLWFKVPGPPPTVRILSDTGGPATAGSGGLYKIAPVVADKGSGYANNELWKWTLPVDRYLAVAAGGSGYSNTDYWRVNSNTTQWMDGNFVTDGAGKILTLSVNTMTSQYVTDLTFGNINATATNGIRTASNGIPTGTGGSITVRAPYTMVGNGFIKKTTNTGEIKEIYFEALRKYRANGTMVTDGTTQPGGWSVNDYWQVPQGFYMTNASSPTTNGIQTTSGTNGRLFFAPTGTLNGGLTYSGTGYANTDWFRIDMADGVVDGNIVTDSSGRITGGTINSYSNSFAIETIITNAPANTGNGIRTAAGTNGHIVIARRYVGTTYGWSSGIGYFGIENSGLGGIQTYNLTSASSALMDGTVKIAVSNCHFGNYEDWPDESGMWMSGAFTPRGTGECYIEDCTFNGVRTPSAPRMYVWLEMRRNLIKNLTGDFLPQYLADNRPSDSPYGATARLLVIGCVWGHWAQAYGLHGGFHADTSQIGGDGDRTGVYYRWWRNYLINPDYPIIMGDGQGQGIYSSLTAWPNGGEVSENLLCIHLQNAINNPAGEFRKADYDEAIASGRIYDTHHNTLIFGLVGHIANTRGDPYSGFPDAGPKCFLNFGNYYRNVLFCLAESTARPASSYTVTGGSGYANGDVLFQKIGWGGGLWGNIVTNPSGNIVGFVPNNSTYGVTANAYILYTAVTIGTTGAGAVIANSTGGFSTSAGAYQTSGGINDPGYNGSITLIANNGGGGYVLNTAGRRYTNGTVYWVRDQWANGLPKGTMANGTIVTNWQGDLIDIIEDQKWQGTANVLLTSTTGIRSVNGRGGQITFNYSAPPGVGGRNGQAPLDIANNINGAKWGYYSTEGNLYTHPLFLPSSDNAAAREYSYPTCFRGDFIVHPDGGGYIATQTLDWSTRETAMNSIDAIFKPKPGGPVELYSAGYTGLGFRMETANGTNFSDGINSGLVSIISL